MSRHPKRAPRRASAATARANAPSSPAPRTAPTPRTPRRGGGKSAPKLTKSDVERGQEITVKGTKNDVWCGEIVRVRANARANELVVRWFDATRAGGGDVPAVGLSRDGCGGCEERARDASTRTLLASEGRPEGVYDVFAGKDDVCESGGCDW